MKKESSRCVSVYMFSMFSTTPLCVRWGYTHECMGRILSRYSILFGHMPYDGTAVYIYSKQQGVREGKPYQQCGVLSRTMDAIKT